MNNGKLYLIALHYCVNDLPDATIPFSRLQKILKSLRCNEQLSQLSLAFLQQRGLHALHRFATGDLSSYENFYELARTEKSIRIQAARAAQQKREAEETAAQQKREAKYARAAEERRAREKDPIYQARVRDKELRTRYGIDFFVEREDFPRLMQILKRVDSDQRLNEDDVEWLWTQRDTYFTQALQRKYHRLEADFFAGEFHKTGDPWNAINASSHYRKCGCARDADELIRTINIERKSSRIQAALYTTHGGALRDLKRWDEAIQRGEQAHKLQPRDYRPCTLLGAIYMETWQFDLGKAWYDKAYERGAPENEVRGNIRTSTRRFTKQQKQELAAVLEHDRRYQSVVKMLSKE